MDLKKIEYLAKIVKALEIAELELSESSNKIRITNFLDLKKKTQEPEIFDDNQTQESQKTQKNLSVNNTKEYSIKSPMVGTFYRSPGPGQQFFVKEGQKVMTDTVLCVIEAMKMMNEVASSVCGTVKSILVKDGQSVDFDQTLMIIEVDK